MQRRQNPCELLGLSILNTRVLIRSVLQYQVSYGTDLLSTAIADLSNLLALLEKENDIHSLKDLESRGKDYKL